MRTTFFILASLFLIACGGSADTSFEEHEFQAISSLGDTLYAPQLIPETEARFKSNLKAARANYRATPDDAEAIIWYGRRTAYLGNYRKAIDIFSEGLRHHPRDARMYRHRGHRYITVREFDKAIRDLTKATNLIKGTEDRIEPDGLPNRQNKPRSTLHTNIWYHLGLAYYLRGHFDKASESFRHCFNKSTNDDMLVASAYWLYMSLQREGQKQQAGDLLTAIQKEMNIIENRSYHQLLLAFKGVLKPENLLEDSRSRSSDPLQNATIGYGVGNWHYFNGRKEKGRQVFRQVYRGKHWNAFGYIAAETDLARLQSSL